MSCFICCCAVCHYAECRYTVCHYAEYHHAECDYAECHVLFIVTPNAARTNLLITLPPALIMLSVVMVNDIMLSVVAQPTGLIRLSNSLVDTAKAMTDGTVNLSTRLLVYRLDQMSFGKMLFGQKTWNQIML